MLILNLQILLEMGEPFLGVNPEYQVGQLGCPNPSANPVGVLQALGIVV